jgi:3-hydroxyisobutyrate dehydrogenase
MAKIGFIGVGNMGGPMLANLVKAQHQVTAFDLSPKAVKAAEDAGAGIAKSAAEAAKDVDTVVSMLPAGKHVREVYLGDGGVLGAVKPGTLLIDCSTIDVDSARAAHAAAEAAGLDMLDAPVSGGVGGATAGTLTFMCGGSDKAFERARPILEKMGKNIVHAGPAGNGQAAKICNNMMLGATMIVTAEAFVLAEKLGLDKQKLWDIASTSSGNSWALSNYCPVPGPVPTSPANNAYKAGFTAAMMLKDLRLAQAAMQSAGSASLVGGTAANVFALFEAAGKDDLDFSAIIQLIRGKA